MSTERRITSAPKDLMDASVATYKAALLKYRDAEKALAEAHQKLPEVAALQMAHKELQEALTEMNKKIAGA